MVDTDLFVQWIDVPDDLPVLPPVDELNDIASLGHQADLYIDDQIYESSSGLLLGPCHTVPRGVDIFNAITPHAGKNAFPPTSNSSPSHVSYASLCPPALSPDSSPTSIASSTPWLRTPTTDLSLANVANLAPVDALWDFAEIEETCSTIHFVDQSGNSLEDIPSQIQDVMPEDIACTPQCISDTSLPLPNTPLFMISPHCVSVSPQAEAVPLGPTHCTSPASSSSHMSQSLFTFSAARYPQETPLPRYSASPSLSPLSTLSFFSQSPSASQNPLPFVNYSSLSPALSLMPLSDGDEKVEGTSSVSSTSTRVTSVKLRGKRSVGTLGDDALFCKIPRRSKARNDDDDDDEWNPGSERVKRPRVVGFSHPTRQTAKSIPNCPPDESSICETSQDSEGHSDATHTCCEFCGQGFTRMSDYIRHIENSASHPETRKVWPCPYCDSALGRKDALGRHIRTIHPGRLVFIPEGVLGSRFPESQKEPSEQQRKMPSRRPLRKDTRRYR